MDAGKNFLNWRGAKPELVITEPELIRELLNDREQLFCKTDIDKYMKKLLGNGLLESEGEKWAKLRKLANKSFHAESLRVRLYFDFQIVIFCKSK